MLNAPISQIKYGREIGKSPSRKYKLARCFNCGELRWVQVQAFPKRCVKCARVERSLMEEGKRSKGPKGYIVIKLNKDNFFYPMAHKQGYVFEHRLVVAKFIGRWLHPWEIVHHKNHIRTDNRIENLQLVSDDRHKQLTFMKVRVDKLSKEIESLREENKNLKSALNQACLTGEIPCL